MTEVALFCGVQGIVCLFVWAGEATMPYAYRTTGRLQAAAGWLTVILLSAAALIAAYGAVR